MSLTSPNFRLRVYAGPQNIFSSEQGKEQSKEEVNYYTDISKLAHLDALAISSSDKGAGSEALSEQKQPSASSFGIENG